MLASQSTRSESLISPKSPKTKSSQSLTVYRCMIAYRFVLALLGGYVLASLSAIFIAESFADQRGSAAMSSTLTAFLLWACAFIWVFMVNKTLKASLGIIVPSIVLWFLSQYVGH